MSKPLFAVGEVVILQSKQFPGLNGECTVLAHVKKGDDFFDPVAKRMVRRVAGPGYLLDVSGDNAVLSDGSPGARLWAESALRKRHQPGEYSFDGLKQILALPVSRGDFA